MLTFQTYIKPNAFSIFRKVVEVKNISWKEREWRLKMVSVARKRKLSSMERFTTVSGCLDRVSRRECGLCDCLVPLFFFLSSMIFCCLNGGGVNGWVSQLSDLRRKMWLWFGFKRRRGRRCGFTVLHIPFHSFSVFFACWLLWLCFFCSCLLLVMNLVMWSRKVSLQKRCELWRLFKKIVVFSTAIINKYNVF